MANPAKQLFDLQEVDLEIGGKRSRIQAIEAQLGESETLISARNDVAKGDVLLAELRKAQRDEETETADVAEKLKTHEGKLYDGSITNAKELGALQTEVDRLKAVKQIHDERLIEIMEKLEAANAAFKANHEKLITAEQDWKTNQAALSKEKEVLNGQIAELEKKRDAVRSGIPAQALEMYDALVGPKQGKAVARVERGTCLGCRISLPVSDVQRVRAGQILVRCSNCGRILLG